MSVKEKMLEAKSLIQQKRYIEAEKILVTVDHPLATEWRRKIAKIVTTAKPAPVKRERYTLKRALILIAAVILTLILAMATASEIVNYQAYEAQKPESRAILSLFCKMMTNTPEHRCEEWANETVKDRGAVWDVWVCDRLYGWAAAPRDFAGCLARDGIYLP